MSCYLTRARYYGIYQPLIIVGLPIQIWVVGYEREPILRFNHDLQIKN